MSSGGLGAALLDALVTVWGDALEVPVLDGPVAGETVYPAVVIVGYDGVSDEGRAGSWRQQYANLGAGAARDESGEVVCAVFVQSGDAAFTTLRRRAVELLGGMSSALRADPTVGINGMFAVEVAGVSMFAGDADGQAVRLELTVEYRGRV